MADVYRAARAYIERGYAPIPVHPREKAPRGEGWQNRRIDADAVEQAFAPNDNIGLLLGEPSGWLVDVDCDCPYARRLAPQFLPPTPMVSGRQSAPDSHYWYRAEGASTKKFQDPELTDGGSKERMMIVELRSTGGQSVVPPSVHPSGEVYQWKQSPPPEPAQVDAAELLQCVQRLAAAALLASRWKEGARHELALATAGALAYAGWAESDAARFVLAVAAAAGDPELSDRRRAVADTYEAVRRGEPATGLPTLAELLGDAVAKKLAEWLNLRRESDAKPVNGEKQEREAASLRLAKAALESITELFTAQDGAIYVSLRRGGHTETHALRSKTFENYLAALCNALSIVPRESTLSEAIAILRGEAARRGETREVHIRVAGDPATAIYLDLCTPDWRVVEITPAGWRVIDYSDCPVRFIRPRHALPLPIPTPGRIEDLRAFVRASESDFLLISAWLLMAIRPDAPYPILALRGEQGSGKSTATRLLRELIDPRASAHAAAPHKLDDLMVQAAQAHIVAFDNLSRIPPWLSDAFCRLATGAGMEKRELYTDAEVVALYARRPIIINAIREIVERPDLADRVLQVELLPIPETERLPERDLLQAWQGARAGILGALVSGASRAMRDFQRIDLPEKPRMADFAVWAAAGVQAWGYTPTQFLTAYNANRAALSDQLTERDVLATAILAFMDEREAWEGTASELLEQLAEVVGDAEKSYLPKPNKLKDRLLEIAPVLRSQGIRYRYRRVGAKGRVHRLEKTATQPSLSSLPSPAGDFELETEAQAVTIQSDGAAVASLPTVTRETPELNSESPSSDGSDGSDDTVGHFSINDGAQIADTPVSPVEKTATQPSLSSLPPLSPDFELKSPAEVVAIPSGDTGTAATSIATESPLNLNSNSPESGGSGDSGDPAGNFQNQAIPDYGEARRQALLRRYLLQQGYLIEGDSEAARAQREALLLQAAADAGYPALSLNGRRTGEGEAYWRMQVKAIAARPLESAICIELFRRAADGSLRKCLDCGGRFSSESALFCASCRECAGTCPYCRGRRTQIFDGDTGLCHTCRRRFPLPDALRASQGEESISHLAQGMESPAMKEV